MNIVGFILTKSNTQCATAGKLSDFQGKPCKVLEFASDGGALCINLEGTALAIIEPEYITNKFECYVEGNIIYPPNLSTLDRMIYLRKLYNINYTNMTKAAIITKSLISNRFDDEFLWK